MSKNIALMVPIYKDPSSTTKQSANDWKISFEQQLISNQLLACYCTSAQPLTRNLSFFNIYSTDSCIQLQHSYNILEEIYYQNILILVTIYPLDFYKEKHAFPNNIGFILSIRFTDLMWWLIVYDSQVSIIDG